MVASLHVRDKSYIDEYIDKRFEEARENVRRQCSLSFQIEGEGFQTGDILRFRSVPLHYAVYIGDGEIVHYNKLHNKLHGKVCVIREKLRDYKKR